MASIDFPTSPTDAQKFTSGDTTYTYVLAKGYWDVDDSITTLGTTTEKTSSLGVVIGALATQHKIQASDRSTDGDFGISSSISGDGLTAVVGASNATGGGAAYVYTRSSTLSSATWTQQAKIVASDRAAADYFGTSVSISSDGNTAIVGAWLEDTVAANANNGAAYIFVRSGTSWSQQAKILASDLEASDTFGNAVSISSDGNTAIVGAEGEDTGAANAGSAYIFTRSGTSWTQQAKIQASDAEAVDYFGQSVSISGDGLTAIVGAGYEDTAGTDAGAAYVFTKSGSTWSEQAKILASDAQGSDKFGHSVSISSEGNTAIVGALGEDTGAADAGAAYIFTRSGTSWTQQAKIQASVTEASAQFGQSVSLTADGNTAIVGAWIEDTAGVNDGAVYIFKRSGTTWTQTQKIQASDAETSDYFGISVGISGDGSVVIAGARGEDTGVSGSGAAYFFAADVDISYNTADISQSSVFTHSGLSADFTTNFTNVPTTNDRTIEVSLVIEQGATGYLPTAVQIDSVAQTVVWENGTQPEPSINSSDVVNFSLIRSAGAWTVLASLTRFTDAAYPAGIALTDFSVGAEAAASGDGGIAYDNTTGVFTYTPPVIPVAVDSASVEAAGALMDSELTDIASIKALDQGVATTDSPTFAGLTVSGATALDGTTTLSTIAEKTSLPEFVLGSVLAEQAKIQASDAEASDQFGFSVSISEDGLTAIVGAFGEDTAASAAGSAYIFTRSGTSWSQQAKIQASDAEANDWFGRTVSISSDGNTAIVGARTEDTGATDAGAAYIFVRSGTSWSEEAKIQASDLGATDNFGISVSISSDGLTAIVGAFQEDTGATDAGAAYIFVKSGTSWTQQAKIQASDLEATDQFGSAVSISSDGNTAIVSSRNEDTGAADAGAAYIFTRSGSTWSEQAKILASDAQALDKFGWSVGISGDGNTAIVGAYFEDAGGADAGAAYIFTRSGSTWSQQAKIQASDAEANDEFGYSVGISSDGLTAIVGARNEDTGAGNAGAAYIFVKSGTTWPQTQKIQASDLELSDQFGYSVSISGDGTRAIVGADLEDTGGSAAGAAYIFSGIPTGTVLHDISQSSIFTHSGLTADFTANFTNVPTIDNRTIETALIIEQGATGYLPTAVQIDGVAQTFVWENGVTPDPSINNSDIVNFTLLRSADTWTVLASLIKFTAEIVLAAPEAAPINSASVEAAGALMDSELTDIVAIKALDQGVATTDSPSFAGLTLSGVPTAPTAAAGTNTTQIATTEFTTTAIANLIDTAPATLDTLNELAAALGDDSNFATTVANSLALKAPLISPSFTGPVTVTGTTTLDGTTTLSATTEKTSLPEFVLASVLAKIQASDAEATDEFGFSVSISSDGNTAIVGARYEDTGGTDAGAAYIFTKSGSSWTQQAKIQASDKEVNDYFGGSVSISDDGNTAIVGAYYEGTGGTAAGAAYIFVRSGTSWTQQAKIQATDKELGDYFGESVSISSDGNTAIVGASFEDTGAANAGAAYIFTRSGTSWSEQAKIQASDKEVNDYFGGSVSISSDGNTAIVGAFREDTPGTDAGAAYIFVRSGTSWTQQAKIQATDKELGDWFGRSVGISGDSNTAIVGARTEDTGGSNAGAAYIFTRSGTSWTQQAKIQSTDIQAGDEFGFSVSISSDGNAAIVGARLEDTGAGDAGAAYIFTRSGTSWSEQVKIQASDAETSDFFGNSVSISSDGLTAIVGAYAEDTGGSAAGAAYIYEAEISSILHDISQSSIFSHSGLVADFTANFINVPTTNDRTISTALIIEQGATGYLPTVVQIDGAAQTILWQGAVAPVPSTNTSDVVSFTLLRSGGAWTVLGTLTKFGSV